MARRPTMSSGFSDWVEHPNKAPRPTGVRKLSASNTKGRNSARVRAFNRLDPLKQRVIAESGNKESYLRGEINYTQARADLIGERATTAIARAARDRGDTDRRGRPNGPVDKGAIRGHVKAMTPAQRRKAEGISSYQDLLDLINDTRDEDGYSPFFYK